MAVPYHIAATALKTIIDSEFVDREANAQHDRLHESLGWEGLAIGISPNTEQATPGNEIMLTLNILVQWYDEWDKKIDPTQAVDPFAITEIADRFRRAVERYGASSPGSTEVWYFKVTLINFINDPTGNKSRFEATIVAYGDNTALIQR